MAKDVVLKELTLKVSISAGYARCPEDGTTFEDVVKKADDAIDIDSSYLSIEEVTARIIGIIKDQLR